MDFRYLILFSIFLLPVLLFGAECRMPWHPHNVFDALHSEKWSKERKKAYRKKAYKLSLIMWVVCSLLSPLFFAIVNL